MTPADVTNLVNWQNANGFKLDMVFNGGGSDLWKADQNPLATADPLLDAFMAAQNQFTWINHTYTHEFLGCIQVAPTVAGEHVALRHPRRHTARTSTRTWSRPRKHWSDGIYVGCRRPRSSARSSRTRPGPRRTP